MSSPDPREAAWAIRLEGADRERESKSKLLVLRLLGPMEAVREGEGLVFPASRKTRALLAYLAVTGRPHRRERLCSLLWDVADDPRGALRWSLSKIRPLVNDSGLTRLVADRESVRFDPGSARVDLVEVRRRCAGGLDALSTEELEELAGEFRGEFLEGMQLGDFHEFQAWCVAEREQARGLHAKILSDLVTRHRAEPERALPFSRKRVEIDPLDEPARADLVRLLVAAGKRREAEEQHRIGMRLLREMEGRTSGELDRAWEESSQRGSVEIPAQAGERIDNKPAMPGHPTVLVGRKAERDRLITALQTSREERRLKVLLVTGEPGVGKSRLIGEMIDEARKQGGTVLDGAAFEAEVGRPYGPWIDALRRLPRLHVGQTLGPVLAPLLPELGGGAETERSQDRLFGAVVELIAARAHSAPPVLVVLDDVQWCDEASASLLHYVARMSRHRPVVVAMAARDGELPDNVAICRVIRGLRRERQIEEFGLEPLSREETALLLKGVSPEADPELVYDESSGNPLFALEIARSGPRPGVDLPRTLNDLVRDRLDRLPSDAGDLLRWAAVLGPVLEVSRLQALTSTDLDALIAALETLERHTLIREAEGAGRPRGDYAFAHDVVRRVVYTEISEPRRRLMHWKIARTIREMDDPDGTLAGEIAHHAGQAGEAAMAAEACVAAGNRCLRLFANSEALSLSNRGMRYAEELPEAERVRLALELIEIRLAARRPPALDSAAAEIEELANRALDQGSLEHARLGFHMISWLRWEGGDWSDARRQILRAEEVSRSGDERQRVVAMAEAARCLTLLERDLGQAEALLLEAAALASRLGLQPIAVADGTGMLRLHRGEMDEAASLFETTRGLARQERDRMNEFRALEHLFMVELSRGRHQEANRISGELLTIGGKLREGSEAPFARALESLSRYAMEGDEAVPDLDRALEELRAADAKHRLAYALTRAAVLDLERGDALRSRERAEEALRLAGLLERPSEIAMARVVLVRAAAAQGDERGSRLQLCELKRADLALLSAQARSATEDLLEEHGSGGPGGRS